MMKLAWVLVVLVLAGCEAKPDRLTQVCTYSTLQPNGELIVTHYLCDREKQRFLQQPDDVLSICNPNGEAVGTWRALNYNQDEIGRTVVMVARGWSDWPAPPLQGVKVTLSGLAEGKAYRMTIEEAQP